MEKSIGALWIKTGNNGEYWTGNIELPDGTKQYSEHPNPNTDVVALQIAPQTLINDCSIWGAIDLEEQSLNFSGITHKGCAPEIIKPVKIERWQFLFTITF